MDPIYVWNDTGTGATPSMIGTSDYSPNECGAGARSVTEFVQLNRDDVYGVARRGTRS